MAFPFAYIPFGHLAGGRFDFQAGYAAAASGRKVLVSSNSELQSAIATVNAEGAGTEPYYIAMADGAYTISLYSGNAITAQRTVDSQVYIGPLNVNGVTVGINGSGTAFNDGNQIVLSGASYINLCGLNFRYARRSSSNPALILITNQSNHIRVTGCGFLSCGSGTGPGVIEIDRGSNTNTIDHNVSWGYRSGSVIVPATKIVRMTTWDGSVRITAASRSGTTATFTFLQPDSNGYTITDQDTVIVRGFVESLFNVTDATVNSVTINGASSTFTVTVPDAGATTGTIYTASVSPALTPTQALGKNSSYKCPFDNVIEYNSSYNFNNAYFVQNGNYRIHVDDQESGDNIIRYNWDHDFTFDEYVSGKNGGTTFLGNIGLGTSQYMMRSGNDKVVSNNIRPYASITTTGATHSVKNNIAKNITLRKWGAFDGDQANGAYDQWFPTTDDSTFRRNTLVEGTTLLDLCRTEGFTVGGVSRLASHIPDGITIEDTLLIKSSAGVAVSYNGATLTNFTFDGAHYDLTTATAGEDSTNKSTGSLAGLWFRPLSGSPAAVLSGGQGAAAADAEGRASFVGIGALAYHDPDFIFEDTFTGSADVAVTSHDADTNETGSVWVTPTTSWLLDGSGAAKATAANQANFINMASTEHRIEMIANAGGAANLIRVWIGANAVATSGLYTEFNLSTGTATLYSVTGGVHTQVWQVTGIPTLGASSDNEIWAFKRGTVHQWAIRGMPIIHYDISGFTGSYCGFQHGAFINNAARIKSFNVETDVASGGGGETPTTEVISYQHSFTGSSGTQFASATPDIGDGQSYLTSTEVSTLRLSGATGELRGNTNNNDTYILYQLLPDSDLTQDSADCEISFEVTKDEGYTSGSHHPSWFAGLRVQDSNNMYGFALMGDSTASEKLGVIYSKLSGSVSTLDSANIQFTVGDIIKYRIIGDALEILHNDVSVVSATDANISSSGDIYFGMGAYFDATHDIAYDFRIDNLTYTEYAPDVAIDPTAPIFLTSPQVVGVGNDILSFEAQCDIEAKHYVVVWDTTSDMTLDNTGVGHVIAGEDPDGSSAADSDSDTNTDAGEVVNLSVSGLSASPKWKWAYTATAESDDTEMTMPIVGEQLLVAPTDYTYTEITDASLVNQNGIIYTTFGATTNGSIIKASEKSANGNDVMVDSFGNVSVDTGGQSDSYTVDLWDYDTRAWQGEETINILTPYTITISQVISSGSPLDGVAVFWKYYPGATVETMDTVTPESGTGTFTAGDLTFTVQVNTPGLVIVEDQATQARYYIGQETPS